MRRITAAATTALVVSAMAAGGAAAASPYAGCGVGAGSAGQSRIEAWQLLDQAALEGVVSDAGGDPANAARILEATDKNDDGRICLLIQRLPNDASGSDIYFVYSDNRAREK